MVYLDNNATTRLDDAVLQAMLPFLKDEYGNASSTQHRMGRKANEAIQKARMQIAQSLSASDPSEIFFTSGATEAINWAVKGVAERYTSLGNHIITSQTEHPAVLQTCAQLQKKGFNITYLPVNQDGLINLEHLKSAITDKTILICLMAANNETGIINPITAVANICKERNVLFFCDATQYIGKTDQLNLQEIPIDLLCISAHKFHGPKGIGALYIRKKRQPIQLETLIAGGQQENGFRGGTYPVHNLVGMGEAIARSAETDWQTVADKRDYLERQLAKKLKHVAINGEQQDRLCNTSSITIKHVLSSELMSQIPDIAISSGSACATGTRDPSHVLLAMGLSPDDAKCTIRISLSKYTTDGEIEQTIEAIVAAVHKIRSNSPTWMLFEKGLLD